MHAIVSGPLPKKRPACAGPEKVWERMPERHRGSGKPFSCCKCEVEVFPTWLKLIILAKANIERSSAISIASYPSEFFPNRFHHNQENVADQLQGAKASAETEHTGRIQK